MHVPWKYAIVVGTWGLPLASEPGPSPCTKGVLLYYGGPSI